MGTVEDGGCIWEQWKMVGAYGNSEKGTIIKLVGVMTKTVSMALHKSYEVCSYSRDSLDFKLTNVY